MKTDTNYAIIAMSIFLVIALFCFRAAIFSGQRFDVYRAAEDLVREQREMGKEIKLNDGDILTEKILPKSSVQYALNPFIWTMKQRSANDDLLQACFDAAERRDAMDAMEYAEDLSTFEDRFKTWEVNFEQAKLSLAK